MYNPQALYGFLFTTITIVIVACAVVPYALIGIRDLKNRNK